MLQRVEFARAEAPSELRGLIDWFWAVRWSLPGEDRHRQDVVSQPGVNLSVGTSPPPGPDPPPGPYPLRFVVNGVSTDLTTRVLSGSGWNLAAKTATGGFGAWLDDVATINNLVLPAHQVLPAIGHCEQIVAEQVANQLGPAADEFPNQVCEAARPLADALLTTLAERPDARVRLAREIAQLSALAEFDREIRTVEQLAAHAGVSARTLQRRFASCAGVGPTWVIRRFRLLDAAELVRDGQAPDWAAAAVQLGYADQAHLVRDFASVIGVSPAAYARQQRQTGAAQANW